MSRMVELPAASVEYVRVEIRARVGGEVYDPTGDAVEMAFKPGTTPPEAGDWEDATWETDDSSGTPVYRAVCLVGPGAVELEPDTWRVWVRVTGDTEVPVRPAGFIKII